MKEPGCSRRRANGLTRAFMLAGLACCMGVPVVLGAGSSAGKTNAVTFSELPDPDALSVQAAGGWGGSTRTNQPLNAMGGLSNMPALVHCDGAGRIQLLSVAGEPLQVSGETRVAGPAWAFYGSASSWSATGVTFRTEPDGVAVWTGVIPLDNGGLARYEQRIMQSGLKAVVTIGVTAETDLRMAGITYFLQLPARLFSESRVSFYRGPAAAGTVEAPGIFKSDMARLLFAPAADRVQIQSGQYQLGLQLDRPRPCSFQDDRQWGVESYSLLIPVISGTLMRRGETARLQFELSLAGQPDREPVTVRIRDVPEGVPFEGFGGNFVYGLEGPMATSLVERLAPVRGRIEMALHDWEPENDNESADETDWARLEARDRPGTEMRRRFELAALLAKRGVPLIISIWDLPEWMYEGPPQGRWAYRREVKADQWAEVVESAATYLVYLKKQYGVEPELFSFNEPEAGVRVLFSAEQHRQMIIRFGDRFAALGLKTRILLADVAQPRGTESFGVYALSDPAARRHIGAVGFHSWGGAMPLEYAAWPALARRLGVPLDVTEVGWNSGSWRTPHEMNDPYYVIQEAKLILDLLVYARPRSMLIWEYTDDYPLLKVSPAPEGGLQLTDTPRLTVLEQLIRLTPTRAQGLEIASSSRDVPAVAYRFGSAEKPGLVVHLANTGAERMVSLSGLPPGAVRMTMTLLSASGGKAKPVTVPVKEGQVDLRIPPWSLVSLHDCELRGVVVQ